MKELAGRELRSIKSLEVGKRGILLKEPTFEQYIDDAFDQIYQFGRRDHVIVRTMISVLAEILSAVPDLERAAVVVKEVSDMELQSLYTAELSSPFPLIENRDYVRKALKRFYGTAAQRFDDFDEPVAGAEYRKLAAAVDGSFGT